MTRRRKLILWLVAAPILLVLALVVAALTPAVQTFAARKALAGQGTVEHVSVGTGGAEITGLQIEQPGVKISVPSFKADLPLVAAAGGSIDVRALVARDIVIDYDPVAAAVEAAKNPAEPAEPSGPFAGLLKLAELPPGLQVNGLDLAGVVRVSGPQPATLEFTLVGGGVATGKQGRFDLKLVAKAGGLGEVGTSLELLPTLDSAGQLSSVLLQLDAKAKGGLMKKEASLRTEAGAVRDGEGETWSLRLYAADKTLVELKTKWAPGAANLPGSWKLDITDSDFAPLIPFLDLPSVKLAGEGAFSGVGSSRTLLNGALTLQIDKVENLKVAAAYQSSMSFSLAMINAMVSQSDPAAGLALLAFLEGLHKAPLPALGTISLTSRFDVEASADEAKVNAFKLDLASGSTPALAIAARQPFTYALATGKIVTERPSSELLSINLLGLPSAWLQTFVPELSLGGPVTGAWSARPEGDGVALDTTAPLTLTAVRYGPAGAPLVAVDSITLDGLRVRQNAAGLEASLTKLRVVAAGADLVTGKFSATQKTGAPLVAQAEFKALLAALADQPVLRGQTRLSAGQAVLTLDASVADATKAGGRLAVTGLRAGGESLPEVRLDFSAEQNAAGVVTARLPLTVSGGGAKQTSDIELTATVTPSADAASMHVAAKLASQTLSLPDLQRFSAAAATTPPKPAAPAPSEATKPAADAKPADAPLWAGLTGELDISLARIVAATGIEITNTTGRVALTKDSASLEKLRTLLSTGGTLDVGGALRWLAATKSYAVAAEVKGSDFAVGPLLRALDPASAVPLEGTYALQAGLTGAGADPATAASSGAAELKLTGKSGVLRALNLDTNLYGKIGGSKELGLAAGLLGAALGDNEAGRIARQTSAANAFARKLANLPYDEISVQAKRGADGSIEVREIRLQSPEIRLAGSGSIGGVEGLSFLDQALKLNLDFGAGGEIASQLGTLRLLKGSPVDGYTHLAEPVVLDGTLRKVGTAQLNRLVTKSLGL